ncbi:hypothetical protein DXG01_005884, partial [Tephrocybe rancida]
KFLRRLSAVPAYKAAHLNLDPTSLLCPEHMSDEGSGPEDNTEDFDNWKSRMAQASGFVDTSSKVTQH